MTANSKAVFLAQAGRIKSTAVWLGARGLLPVSMVDWFHRTPDRKEFIRHLDQFISEQMKADTREASELVDCATMVLDEVRRHG